MTVLLDLLRHLLTLLVRKRRIVDHVQAVDNLIVEIEDHAEAIKHALDHFGVSELFLAPARDARAILATRDLRLRCWLLGFTARPIGAAMRPESGTSQIGVQPTVWERESARDK